MKLKPCKLCGNFSNIRDGYGLCSDCQETNDTASARENRRGKGLMVDPSIPDLLRDRHEPSYGQLMDEVHLKDMEIKKLREMVENMSYRIPAQSAALSQKAEKTEKTLSGHVTREMLLDQAKEIVTKYRQSQYGTPEDNFTAIASMWTTHLRHALKEGVELAPYDVAAMMILLKIVRCNNSPTKSDNWLDMAGYAACGAEVATAK